MIDTRVTAGTPAPADGGPGPARFRSVLITGGLGAIGSFVTKAMLDAGAHVTTFSRTRDLSIVAQIVGDTALHRVTPFIGDLRDVGPLNDAVASAQPDLVVHLSSYLHKDCERDPVGAFQVNVGGTIQVLEAAARHAIDSVVVVTAKAAYGAVPAPYRAPQFKPLSEDLSWPPANVYGLTKRAAEQLCGYYRAHRGVDTACLRLGSTYGPGKGTQHGGYPALKGRIIEAAARGTSVRVRGLDVRDDLVYNKDVARAVLCAATADPGRRTTHVYNISGGRLVALTELVAEVNRCCPDAHVTFELDDQPRPAGLQVRLDISRARNELGYQPEYPGVEGISDYVSIVRASSRTGVVAPATAAALEIEV